LPKSSEIGNLCLNKAVIRWMSVEWTKMRWRQDCEWRSLGPSQRNMTLDGKRIVVLGGSSGIGLATAQGGRLTGAAAFAAGLRGFGLVVLCSSYFFGGKRGFVVRLV
jgi:hypothetical protein